MKSRQLTLVVTSMLMLALAGCVDYSNGNDHVLSLEGNASIGQNLIDLKTALDSGAVTQEEYDRIKGALLALVEGTCEDGAAVDS